MVPLHSALIAEGFLDYVASQPAGPLFPQFKLWDGKRSTAASKAASKFVRDVCGIVDEKVAPSHSWRHTIVSLLAPVALPYVACKITGHTIAGAVAGYIHVSIPDMKAAIELLPGIAPCGAEGRVAGV
jgi:hypothetical protein